MTHEQHPVVVGRLMAVSEPGERVVQRGAENGLQPEARPAPRPVLASAEVGKNLAVGSVRHQPHHRLEATRVGEQLQDVGPRDPAPIQQIQDISHQSSRRGS